MARSTFSPLPVADTSVNEVSGRPGVPNLLASLRPSQWTKNLLVFAALVFGRRLLDPGVGGRSGRGLRDFLRAAAVFVLGGRFGAGASVFDALLALYSVLLKQIVIVDILTIAAGAVGARRSVRCVRVVGSMNGPPWPSTCRPSAPIAECRSSRADG